MTGTSTTRPGEESDREFLFRLTELALGSQVARVYGEWDEKWQRDHFELGPGPERHLIVERDGAPIGCILVDEDEGTLTIQRLYLLPEHQNEGIGSRLVSEVIDRARTLGKSTHLQVFKGSPALRFYERLGFQAAGESTTHVLMEIPYVGSGEVQS